MAAPVSSSAVTAATVFGSPVFGVRFVRANLTAISQPTGPGAATAAVSASVFSA